MWTDVNGQSNKFNFLLLSNSQVALEADIRKKENQRTAFSAIKDVH